jgi:hypothetical protein
LNPQTLYPLRKAYLDFLWPSDELFLNIMGMTLALPNQTYKSIEVTENRGVTKNAEAKN